MGSAENGLDEAERRHQLLIFCMGSEADGEREAAVARRGVTRNPIVLRVTSRTARRRPPLQPYHPNPTTGVQT